MEQIAMQFGGDDEGTISKDLPEDPKTCQEAPIVWERAERIDPGTALHAREGALTVDGSAARGPKGSVQAKLELEEQAISKLTATLNSRHRLFAGAQQERHMLLAGTGGCGKDRRVA